ncbi:type II toxin-antitoxin system RelE/ParE family toxin [Lichenibacterium ramalinae]|uniref:Type II toxin-antitoxin system RelE/ParE family toxin n=1 Tax=Lichenibacterium ramalinae TaxID=2316527 RepID=A0A4Q2RB50_9HYPH|nr:type II toxin-antitoxin system RelE/ParE family toxin [Lichenibacterium ramalinae]RYB03466.1 type II toxin-antitoxin system RelE/ParE family toxin [Lichenibacterium ramalinae]
MGRVRFTRRARLDLLDLWRHVAAHDSGRADDLLDRIEASCRVLRDHPRFGRARPDVGEGARMLVIERWIALYRIVGDDVQVVRIVDGARDLGQLGWAAAAPRGE